MLLNCILLAVCVSLDSLGIGLTYGLKNTKISFYSKIILLIISVTISGISVVIGKCIGIVLSPNFSKILGCILLCIMGIWIILQSITNNKIKIKKDYHFFIKFLGITILTR